jgi:hypothetical protein
MLLGNRPRLNGKFGEFGLTLNELDQYPMDG